MFALTACSAPARAPEPAPQRYPKIPNGGGATIDRAALVSVTFAADARGAEHAAFVDWFAKSGWLTAVAGEYGHAAVEHRAHVTLPAALPPVLLDGDLPALLSALP